MYIKISRLCILIIASIFIGMGIVFCVQYSVTGLSIALPITSIAAMLILSAFILAVQITNNKADKKKLESEKPKTK